MVDTVEKLFFGGGRRRIGVVGECYKILAGGTLFSLYDALDNVDGEHGCETGINRFLPEKSAFQNLEFFNSIGPTRTLWLCFETC